MRAGSADNTHRVPDARKGKRNKRKSLPTRQLNEHSAPVRLRGGQLFAPRPFRARRFAVASEVFPRRTRCAIRCSRRLAIPAPTSPRDPLFTASRYSRAERAARSVVRAVSLFPRRTRCAIWCSRRLAIPAPKSFRTDRAARSVVRAVSLFPRRSLSAPRDPLFAPFCRCRTRKNARKSPASRFYALILAFRSFILL